MGMEPLKTRVMCLLVVLVLAYTANARTINVDVRHSEDEEILTHKVKLLEQSVSGYVHEFQPQIADLQEKLGDVTATNDRLQEALMQQEFAIQDLKWAVLDIKKHELSREEKDMITELRWTTWDLKQASFELQEEACYQTSRCTDWPQWSVCSVKCGLGTQSRSRACTNSGRFRSMCNPPETETRECKGDKCIPESLSQNNCQKGYVSFHGYCFRFSGQQENRLVSLTTCEDEESHLVYIDSKEKQIIVEKYLQIVAPEFMTELSASYDQLEYWDSADIDTKTNVALDGVRPHQRTEFYNWRETEITYFNWAVGEPPNSRSDDDYCVTMNVNTGDWYLKCCSLSFYYICEANVIDF